MKKSELKNIISEEISKLFEVKYAQTDNLRIWLSADKKAIYLDNISETGKPQKITKLINELKKEFNNLVIVRGNNKVVKSNQIVVMHNINENTIDEDKLEKIFMESYKLNEDKSEKLWTDVFNAIDKNVPKYNCKTVKSYNSVVSSLEDMGNGTISNSVANHIATNYHNYKCGEWSIDKAIKETVKFMKKYEK